MFCMASNKPALLILLAEPGPPKTMPDEEPIPAEPTLATPEPSPASRGSDTSEVSEPLPHEELPAMLDVHPAHHAHDASLDRMWPYMRRALDAMPK